MLFIPTSKQSIPLFTKQKLAKGQLYNLDRDQFLNFQFNPQTFDVRRDFNWGVNTGIGDDTGGDLLYLTSGPHTFDLTLLFMADPGVPAFEYNTDLALSGDEAAIDFKAIEDTFESWTAKIDRLGRPSRIRVRFGGEYRLSVGRS